MSLLLLQKDEISHSNVQGVHSFWSLHSFSFVLPSVSMCVTLGVPFRGSQTAGHSINKQCLFTQHGHPQISVPGVQMENAIGMSHQMGSGLTSTMYPFPISLQRPECLLLVAFISLFDSVWLFFLPSLQCIRQDILLWSAFISRLCCFNGINRILWLHWNIVRACIRCAVEKRTELDYSIIYRGRTFFSSASMLCDLLLGVNSGALWGCRAIAVPRLVASSIFLYSCTFHFFINENEKLDKVKLFLM